MVARNERERRRGEIEVLLGAQDPNVLVGEVSPFSSKFWKEFHDQFRAGTQRLFGDLCRMLPGIPASSVLANAWAVAAAQPLWLALLARSVDGSQDEELLRERDRLVDLTLASTNSDPLAEAILELDPASEAAPPDLRHCWHVMPGLRLRYALAHELAAGASPLDLVQVAANQPNASTWIRRRELLRALRVVAESRASLPQLTKSQFWALPPRQQRLVISHPEVMALLLPKEIAGEEGLHAKVDAAHRAARTTRETLCRLRASLATRELIRVQSLLQGLTDDVATLDQAKVVFAGLGSLPDNNTSWARYWRTTGPLEDPVAGKQPCGYVPLTPHAKKLLLNLVPGFKIPTWWKLTPAEIAARLARGGLAVSAIPPAELARVSQGWGTEELAMLAAAGLYGLVPKDSVVWERLDLDALCKAVAVHASLLDLIARRVRSMPNALPVLAMLGTSGGTRVRDVVSTALTRNLPDLLPTTWGHWTANCIGTSVWVQYQWFASTGMDPLREGMALLESGRKPLDTAGFRNVLRGLLVSEQRPDKDLVGVLVSLMVLDQELGDQVLLAIPVQRLARLVQSRDLPAPLRSRLEEIGPPELRDASWRYRLSRVATADQLRTTILERPDQWTKLEWNHDWLALPGTNEVRALPLVLVAKRDPKLLLTLRARMSEAEFASAVREAADLLPATRRRERGYLQLVAALGSELCRCLKVVLMQSDRGSAPGCRLDALYREYLLPKKSGGNRVISVPPRHLKRVQRAILEKLLTPLGAHDAAFGFVPKRSILGNASVHVGQRVVSNVDVSNCFPSVKWPLVLGVLRRDLGSQIGQEAVSLLVDICTSKGGLPIGAPTSPALLNRVLLRTDEVLHQAALARECRYTRYADDLTFSGDHRAVQMLGVAKRTLSQIGLALDEKKTTIYRPGRRQMVTGLVVNKQVAIPRRIRRRLRAAIHAAEKGAQPHWHGREATQAATTGRLSFLCKVHPEEGAALKERWQRAMKRKANKTDG